MTPEEIKKIAEEYAHKQWGKPVSHTTSEFASELKDFLKDLNERYCVVERSKVVEMYPHFDNFNTFNRGVCYCLRILFGSDIRKEEEE